MLKFQAPPCLTALTVAILMITPSTATQQMSVQCNVDSNNANGAIITFAFVKGSDTVIAVDAYDYTADDTTLTANKIADCSLDTASASSTDRVAIEVTVDFNSASVPCGALKEESGGVYTYNFLFRSYATADLISVTDKEYNLACRSDQLSSTTITSSGYSPVFTRRISVLETQKGAYLRLIKQSTGEPAGVVSVGDPVYLSLEFYPSLNEGPDNYGKEFYVGFLSNEFVTGSSNSELGLVILPKYDVNTYVTVTTAFGSQTITITSRTATPLIIDEALMGCAASGVMRLEDKGVYISAFPEVSVTVYNTETGSQGRYTALPLDVLGVDYYSISKKGINVPTEVLVVATEDATDVTVAIPSTTSLTLTYDGTTYAGGESVTVTMSTQQTLHMCLESSSAEEPVAGLHITSTSPVAVISGNPYVGIGNADATRIDHVVVQVPPTNRFGKDFVLIPSVVTTDARSMLYLVEAAESATTVTRKDTNTDIVLANAGDVYELTLVSGSSAFELTSDKPILVAQLMNSPVDAANEGFDPSMVLMPSRQQWGPSLDVYSMNDNFGIAVVFTSQEDADNFQVNSASISTNEAAVLGDNGYLVGFVNPLPSDTRLSLSSTSAVSHMMVLAYSQPSDGTSGAAFHPAGMRQPGTVRTGCVFPGLQGDMIDNDCDGRIDEEFADDQDRDNDGKYGEDTVAGIGANINAVAIRPVSCKVSASEDFTGTSNTVYDITLADGCRVDSGHPFFSDAECAHVSGTGTDRKQQSCGVFAMKMFPDSPKSYFQCEIIYCYSDSDTDCTTDICRPTTRRRRQSDVNRTYVVTDVWVTPVTRFTEKIIEISTDPLQCLENVSFQAVSIVLVLLFTISFIAAIFFWCQLRKQRRNVVKVYGRRPSKRKSF